VTAVSEAKVADAHKLVSASAGMNHRSLQRGRMSGASGDGGATASARAAGGSVDPVVGVGSDGASAAGEGGAADRAAAVDEAGAGADAAGVGAVVVDAGV
jgi:hypothetical protein